QNQSQSTTDNDEYYYFIAKSAFVQGFIVIGTFVREFHEEIVAVGTVFIAAFTIILGFATAALYLATRDLVKGAELTAKQQLRAYVLADTARISNLANPTEVPEGHVILKNFGQTPAYDVLSSYGIALSSYPPPPTERLSVTDAEMAGAKSK